MNNYYIQLGNTPELSFLELNSVVKQEVKLVADHLALTQLKDDQEAKNLINSLGGSVKITKEIDDLNNLSLTEITNKIAEFLINQKDNKIHFAISEYGRDHLPKIEYHQVKNIIEQSGKSARFIEGSRLGLSASILLHKKKVIELYIIQTANKVMLAQTVAVQDIDLWTVKDRGKPYFDRKKGMLPPKVAKMMLNIALGDNPPQKNRDNLLLDPFVGTGTILIEALLTGLDVVGSDLDPSSIQGTKENITWLKGRFNITNKAQILQFDATKIMINKKIQYIVTEPFLGKPKPNLSKLPFIFKGLSKLYLGAFKHWTQLLDNNASLVIVFPLVKIKNRNGKIIEYSLEKLIDKLASLGYTTVSKSVLYHRPHAVVQRQIYRFKFNK